jgi:Raf kinase inhibitor-like YbhB/YbcL family protein
VLCRLALAFLVTGVACGSSGGGASKNAQPTAPPASGSSSATVGGGSAANLGLTSSAFTDAGAIPGQYTCNGANQSPPLSWGGVPAGTASLALRLQDIDTPQKFVHWLVYDIKPSTTSLAAGESPPGAKQAPNSFGRPGYGGPCPPSGQRHRYVFTLLALATELNVSENVSPTELWATLERSAVTGKGELTGTYERSATPATTG